MLQLQALGGSPIRGIRASNALHGRSSCAGTLRELGFSVTAYPKR